MPEPDDALTFEAAAAVLGVAKNTVRTYRAKGLIPPVPGTEGRGQQTLFYRSDVEALRDLRATEINYDDRRRKRREAMIAAGGRTCNGPCGRFLIWSAFEEHPLGLNGHHSQCRECKNAKARLYAQKYRDKRCDYKRTYGKANRAKVMEAKRVWQKQVTEAKDARWLHQRQYMSERRYLLIAVDDGKRSPIHRATGFAVVRMADGKFRAARLDKPFEAGEIAVAHYHCMGPANTWVISTPPICRDYTFYDRLVTHEQNKRKTVKPGRPRGASKVTAGG